jgi:hypothetical protein
MCGNYGGAPAQSLDLLVLKDKTVAEIVITADGSLAAIGGGGTRQDETAGSRAVRSQVLNVPQHVAVSPMQLIETYPREPQGRA